MSGKSIAQGELSLAGGNLTLVIVAAVIALVALGFAATLVKAVLSSGKGTEKMQEIAGAVQEGAQAYLLRQFKTLGIFVVIAVVVLFFLPVSEITGSETGVKLGRSIFFIIGALFSASIGAAGMWLATRANVRVAAAARKGGGGRTKAMQIAFRTGGVVGFLTVGLGLFGASLVVLIYRGDAPDRSGGLRLRRRAARDVHAGRRRHLHQGGRRRRRPGRQGGAEHPRGRPAQRRHDRRQRGRQRRRLRRYGRRPVRVVRGNAGRGTDPGPRRLGHGRPRVPADRRRRRRAGRDHRCVHHPAATLGPSPA